MSLPSYATAAPAAECENTPLSKRLKFSEVQHNMDIEDIPSKDDGSDSSCSTLSAPGEFDSVSALINATRYVRSHLQSTVLHHDTELSVQNPDPYHRLSPDTIGNLARSKKFPSWKLDSIKAGGSLLVFGNDDNAPLSEIAGPPGPRSRVEGIATTPQTFHSSPTSWKIASAQNDSYIFLETIKGAPPETVMWTDDQHGNRVNPTKWISSTPKHKSVYHYNSQPPVADKFFSVNPNYVCDHSKKSAACILVQKKGYRRQIRNAENEGSSGRQHQPQDGVDGPVDEGWHSLNDKIFDTDHELALAEYGLVADSQQNRVDDVSDDGGSREHPHSISRLAYGYDAAHDDDGNHDIYDDACDDASTTTEDTEEDHDERFPVFERSTGAGIRAIYVTRDPESRERIVLVDYVQEEDERYRYVRERLASNKRPVLSVNSLTIDCLSISEIELKARLHLAYDNLERRRNTLIREGKIDGETHNDPPRKVDEMPFPLLMGDHDENPFRYDGNVSCPDNSDGNIPIHGGRCGSAKSSPISERKMVIEEFKSPRDDGFYCRSFRIDGEMIQISAEYDLVYVRAGGATFRYPWNTNPQISPEEAVGLLNSPWWRPTPPVMTRLLKMRVVYEAVVEALEKIFEGARRDPSESSYLSGSEHPLILTPSRQAAPTRPVVGGKLRASSMRRMLREAQEERDQERKERMCDGEELMRIALGCQYDAWAEGVRGRENPLNKPVCLGDDKPLERKENLVQKLVAPESDVKALSGGEKENSSKQKTTPGAEELLDMVSSMQEEIQRLSHQREADQREMVRMAGVIDRLEGEVAELRGKLRAQRNEEEEGKLGREEELEEELRQWGPARGQQDQIVGEGVDLIEFDDPSDFEKVLPAEDGGDSNRVAVVTEQEPLAPIPGNTTQLIVVATGTGAAARILERVRGDVRLCRSLVYLEVRGGQLDIEDDDFCQLIQLCPDLVGVAIRGGVNLTDVSMRCVLTSCRMICGLEISGQPSTPGRISSRPLKGIPYPWQGCSLRELILRHQPGAREEEMERILAEERPCLRVTLVRGGEETVSVARSVEFPPHTYRAPGDLGRWVSLREELWTEEGFFRRSQEGIWEAVREGVARSSVLDLLTYKPDCGGLTWMLDDYQMEGVKRVNLW
ncbi:hypothetical protein TWF718_008511 [Orbilia javanica]|uniref:Uncharacterized protein n=1 Tax=Orbilia javanica TaxID=47235 RepID=A0AAN8RD61_9PEZI